MANVWFNGIAHTRTHIVSFELVISPVTLLLQDKEMSFKLELIGTTWLMLYIFYELLLEIRFKATQSRKSNTDFKKKLNFLKIRLRTLKRLILWENLSKVAVIYREKKEENLMRNNITKISVKFTSKGITYQRYNIFYFLLLHTNNLNSCKLTSLFSSLFNNI